MDPLVLIWVLLPLRGSSCCPGNSATCSASTMGNPISRLGCLGERRSRSRTSPRIHTSPRTRGDLSPSTAPQGQLPPGIPWAWWGSRALQVTEVTETVVTETVVTEAVEMEPHRQRGQPFQVRQDSPGVWGVQVESRCGEYICLSDTSSTPGHTVQLAGWHGGTAGLTRTPGCRCHFGCFPASGTGGTGPEDRDRSGHFVL